MNPSPRLRRRQRGAALFDALIAFLVLALGLVAVARLQGQSRLTADVARQRAEAVRLAQAEIESLRSFATIAAAPGGASFDAIAAGSRAVAAQPASFTVTRRVDADPALALKHVQVEVAWVDRSGGAQQVVLGAAIGANPPALGGALGLARHSAVAAGAFGRSIDVPLAAKALGDGRSAIKPVEAGSVALVFDDRSGRVVGRCVGVDPATATRDLTVAHLLACDATPGRLVSGVVRFSSASPPDVAAANDAPLPLSVALASGSGFAAAPVCNTDAMKTVRSTAAGLRLEALPIGAAAPAGAVATGERFVAYHCVVYPAAGAAWSGRTTLVPSGWTIGAGAGEKRVCRYSSDLDASGAVDAAIEHPAAYAGVGGGLAQQNFLVVGGAEACPAGAAVHIAGNNGDVPVDLGTAAHQP